MRPSAMPARRARPGEVKGAAAIRRPRVKTIRAMCARVMKFSKGMNRVCQRRAGSVQGERMMGDLRDLWSGARVGVC